MAITIVRAGLALPNAFGILITDTSYAPRYRPGDMIEADTTPPNLGDEVVCETDDGGFAIGYLVQISGNHLVLADSCHVKHGPDVSVTATKYWRVAGCHVNYARQLASHNEGVAA